MPIPMNRPGQAMTPEQRAAEQDMNPNSVKNIGTIAQRAAADPGNPALQRRAAEQAQFNSMTPAQRAANALQRSQDPAHIASMKEHRAAMASRLANLGKPAAPVPPGGPRPQWGAASAGATPPAGAGGPMPPGVAPAGYTQGLAKGGNVGGSASGRADGCAERGKTKGRFV